MTNEHRVGPEDEVPRWTQRGGHSRPGTAPRMRTIRATRAGSWKADPFGHDALAGYLGAYRAGLRGYHGVTFGTVAHVRRNTTERRRARGARLRSVGRSCGVTLAHGGSR